MMTFRNLSTATLFLCAYLGCTCQAADAASRYSAVGGFSIKSNPVPGGVWSYISSGGLMSTKIKKASGFKGLNFWTNNGQYPDSTSVWRNQSGSSVTIDGGLVVIPTDHLLLDGQGDALGSDVRFKAPKSGTYHISGDFEGLNFDEVSHTVFISVNGTTKFSATVDSYNQPLPFTLNVKLASGETVDFVSQATGDASYLGTGLKAVIAGP